MNIKTFEIDWDDYQAVTKLGNQIKSRLGELNSSNLSRKERNQLMFDNCIEIYNTDISSIYSGMNLDPNPIYYVYAHLDDNKIIINKDGRTTFAATLGMEYFPFYIGKGTGDRCYDLNRNENHRKIKQKLSDFKKTIKVIKIIDNVTELEALSIESKLIDIFGLIPYGGRLVNLDEGYLCEERRLLYRPAFENICLLNKHKNRFKNHCTETN